MVGLVLVGHFDSQFLLFRKLACVLIFGDKDLSGTTVVPSNY